MSDLRRGYPEHPPTEWPRPKAAEEPLAKEPTYEGHKISRWIIRAGGGSVVFVGVDSVRHGVTTVYEAVHPANPIILDRVTAPTLSGILTTGLGLAIIYSAGRIKDVTLGYFVGADNSDTVDRTPGTDETSD